MVLKHSSSPPLPTAPRRIIYAQNHLEDTLGWLRKKEAELHDVKLSLLREAAYRQQQSRSTPGMLLLVFISGCIHSAAYHRLFVHCARPGATRVAASFNSSETRGWFEEPEQTTTRKGRAASCENIWTYTSQSTIAPSFPSYMNSACSC